MKQGVPVDWNAFFEASTNGRLMEQLVKLPRERWAERDGYGNTLLHYACRGPNVAAAVALLESRRVGVNSLNTWGNTPVRQAVLYSQFRRLEVLCAAGADLRAGDDAGYTPIDHALWNADDDAGETVRALVANGVRLITVHEDRRHHITPELVAFERGVLRCRTAVVGMLHVKKAGKLRQWDKFLLREVAYAVWASRYNEEWQN